MEPSRTSRLVSFSLLIGIILIIGGLFFKVMATFLVPLFLAALCVVMFRPLHIRILQRCRERQRLAAGLTTVAILLIVLVPALAIGTLAAIEGTAMVSTLEVSAIRDKVAKLRKRLGLDLPFADDVQTIDSALRSLAWQNDPALPAAVQNQPTQPSAGTADLLDAAVGLQRQIRDSEQFAHVNMDELVKNLQTLTAHAPGTVEYGDALAVARGDFYELRIALCGGPYRAQLVELANPDDDELRRWRGKIAEKAQAWLLAAGSATTAFAGHLLIGAFVMVISIYFFLLDGPNIIHTIMKLSPLDDQYEQELVREFDEVSRAVVLATLLSAIAQGILAGFGYWFAGLPSVVLLTMLTMVMALVPFVGATVVWVPAGLWLYVSEERTGAAVGLAIYCMAVVSSADNFIKPWVLQGRSKLHPLLALLSVLGGVQALGPLGILVGPMIVVFLQTLLNILHRELSATDRPAAAK
ncbi:MAG: AI-2E family transporter [Candidatus Anammoximicrobium sp.]|nr:AI-2E family transporter [Candidatus Anammoximicrobium sp.]